MLDASANSIYLVSSSNGLFFRCSMILYYLKNASSYIFRIGRMPFLDFTYRRDASIEMRALYLVITKFLKPLTIRRQYRFQYYF